MSRNSCLSFLSDKGIAIIQEVFTGLLCACVWFNRQRGCFWFWCHRARERIDSGLCIGKVN